MVAMKGPFQTWRAKRRHRRLLQQIIPEEDVDELASAPDVRSSKYINRPGFSLPLMTNNFRRFNARYEILFAARETLLTFILESEWSSSFRTVSSVSSLGESQPKPSLFLPCAPSSASNPTSFQSSLLLQRSCSSWCQPTSLDIPHLPPQSAALRTP